MAILKGKRNKMIAAILAVCVVFAVFVTVLNTWILPAMRYKDAVAFMKEGKYRQALGALFDADGYADSDSLRKECWDRVPT